MSVGNVVAKATKKTRGMSVRKLVTRRKPIIKKALIDAGEFWHERYLPLHFNPSAFFRYRGPESYRPRADSYNKRKQARFGHRNPLEFTGTLKRLVLQEQRVTGTSKRATVNLRGPRYLFPFKKHSRDHDKAAELTQLHPQEGRVLGRRIRTTVEREINNTKGTKVERIA